MSRRPPKFTSIRGRFGTSGHPPFLLKETDTLGITKYKFDAILTLIKQQNSRINQLHLPIKQKKHLPNPIFFQKLFFQLKHCFDSRSFQYVQCQTMPNHSSYVRFFLPIHQFFLVRGYGAIHSIQQLAPSPSLWCFDS